MFVFIKLGGFEFLKQVGSIFKDESANLSSNWLRIGLLVVILKSPIRINCSYLFDSLLIIVLRLVAKSVSLRFSGLYIPATRIKSLHWRAFNFYGPTRQLIINIKRNSTPKFISLFSYEFITWRCKSIAWKGIN